MGDSPVSLVVDCAAWGAHQYQREADALEALAVDADPADAARMRRRAEACRAAALNAVKAAGLVDAVPERYVPLTAEQLEQRERDAVAAIDVAERELRSRRTALLAASDWTELPSSPLDAKARGAWGKYRQALRDLPASTDPLNPEWPTAPTTGA